MDLFRCPAEAAEPVLTSTRLSQVIHNRSGRAVKVRLFLKGYQYGLARNFDELLGEAVVVSLRDLVVSEIEWKLESGL